MPSRSKLLPKDVSAQVVEEVRASSHVYLVVPPMPADAGDNQAEGLYQLELVDLDKQLLSTTTSSLVVLVGPSLLLAVPVLVEAAALPMWYWNR